MARLGALQEGVERLVQLIAPMMPHLAESCWALLGNESLLVDTRWPAVDAALLVVAADDGPMPQTREHLAILGLLMVLAALFMKRGVMGAFEDLLARIRRKEGKQK